MEKMTIHRALSELKLIDAKIEKATTALELVSWKQGKGLVSGIHKQEDFTIAAKAKWDSVTALLERKTRIKSAIVTSNATTKVTVGGKEMTVAEAISNKATLALKKTLAASMRKKYNHVLAMFNKNVEVVKNNLQKLLEFTLGKDNVKPDPLAVDAITKPFMENNEITLVDPWKSEELAEALEKEISTFEADIDAVLSESNAVTFVEV